MNHKRLPPIFYRGIFFGISAWNAYIDEENDLDTDKTWNENIEQELLNLDTPPEFIAPCEFRNDDFDWFAEALCPYYPLDAMDDGEKKVLIHKLRLLGRVYHQPTIYMWWPHKWGTQHHHANIMQSVHPTINHMPGLKSHHPVFRLPTVGISVVEDDGKPHPHNTVSWPFYPADDDGD